MGARRHPYRYSGGTMLSLTYFSTATVPFNDTDLLALLETSRVNNAAAGITGMMIYHQGHFVQVLEGPEDAVRATYDRIARDTRHRDVSVELEDHVEERGFPDWSMGFRDGSAVDDLAGFSTFLDDIQAGKDVPGGTPPHIMLRAFSRPATYRPGQV